MRERLRERKKERGRVRETRGRTWIAEENTQIERKIHSLSVCEGDA
jgi:hypothetical protein